MSRIPMPFTLPALHERRPAALTPPSTRMVVLSFCLVLVGILGGLALSTQWQQGSVSGAPGTTRQGSDRVAVAQTISRLEGEQSDLKRQLTDLQNQLAALQSDAAAKKANLTDITSTLDRERVAGGLVALAGAGVVATYNDSTSSPANANDDPANYILHDYDLRDVLNALWAAGAEATAINDERIMVDTPLYCVGSTIIVNATRLSPPYVVSAIGSSDDLEAALRSSAQVEPLNQRALIYNLGIDIRKDTKVQVPAFNGSYVFHFAQIGDSGP